MVTINTRAADIVARRLFRTMRVGNVIDQGRFRRIDLTDESGRDASWAPGDKLQLRVVSDGMTMRTFTPIGWDSIVGTTILAYVHGEGPGSAWASAAQVGETVQAFGPRRSLDLASITERPIVIGDETSIGLLEVWNAAHPELEPAATLFELGLGSIAPLAAVGPLPGHVIRDVGDAHLVELVARAVQATTDHPHAPLILTGRSIAVTAVRKALKIAGHAKRTTRVKTYWDPSRTGLD